MLIAMTTKRRISQTLQPPAPPAAPGMIVLWVQLFSYRDARARPREQFFPINVYHNPQSPYRHRHALISGKHFDLFTDHASLQRDEPLWFHAVCCTLDLNACEIIQFEKAGGGGRGPTEADTLRALFAALRDFPEGWSRGASLSLID
jgi:hypothetical protein